MDLQYWNQYYASEEAETEPSLFAKFVYKHLEPEKRLADIGCGNGRDSLYFARQGLEVYSVDASETATERLCRKAPENLYVKTDNFIHFVGSYEQYFDYLYSRFTIHAITGEEQEQLLDYAYRALNKDGCLFIEVRCKKDELYGCGELVEKDTYFYNGHRRRFIEKEELEEALNKTGFTVLYSKENRGFAPYRNMDPIVLRVIGQKRI